MARHTAVSKIKTFTSVLSPTGQDGELFQKDAV